MSESTVVGQLLRLLPPPERVATAAGWLPHTLTGPVIGQLLGLALARPLAEGRLAGLVGRRLAIEVTDAALRCALAVGDRRIDVLDPAAEAEATVRGAATDLLLMAGRLEDADTLFFHRRLELRGDVELGLTIRNVLDQLSLDDLPAGFGPLVAGAARLAQARRAAGRT